MATHQNSLEYYLAKFDKRSFNLDAVCAEAHMVRLTEHFSFSCWNKPSIIQSLDLTVAELKDIESCYERKPRRQRLELLMKWKEKTGPHATYRYV